MSLLLLALSCSITSKQMRKKDLMWLHERMENTTNSVEKDLLVKELALRQDPIAIPYLCRYTYALDDSVRHRALDTLNAYDGTVEGRDETYISLLTSFDDVMRRGAAEGIILRLKKEQNIPYLYSSLEHIVQNDPNWQSRFHVIAILEHLHGTDELIMSVAKKDSNKMIRTRAVQALGMKKSTQFRTELFRISQYDAEEIVREEAKKSLQQIGGAFEKVPIAIIPFSVGNEYQELEEGFRTYLRERLEKNALYTIIERGPIQRITNTFHERNINDAKAIQFGKEIGAKQVVTGAFQIEHGVVVLTIKRIDVQTQQILSSLQTSGSLVDFEQIQQLIASKFLEEF